MTFKTYAMSVVTIALVAGIAGLYRSDTSEQSALIIPSAVQAITALALNQGKDDDDKNK